MTTTDKENIIKLIALVALAFLAVKYHNGWCGLGAVFAFCSLF
jgi:hypothetical protein